MRKKDSYDDDFDFEDAPKPRRKAKPAAQATARAIALPRQTNPMLAVLIARPGATIACAAFAALMTGIAVNALVLQKGRHPAPLFAARSAPDTAPAASPAPAANAAPAAKAQPQPAEAAGQAESAPAKQALPAPPPRPAAEPKQAAKAETKSDAIGALLRNGPAGAADASKTVMSAQRALAKLGHAVKADGMYGPGTRQAIEAFERAHKLPVTGELNPRTTRKLAAVAGMPVE